MDISGLEPLPIYGNELQRIASGGAITGGVSGRAGSEVSSAAAAGFDGGGLSGSAVTAGAPLSDLLKLADASLAARDLPRKGFES